MKLSQSEFSNRYGMLFIIAMWTFFQALWYAVWGVSFALESEKYIGEAQYLIKYHHLSQFRYIFYFSTIAVIAFSHLSQIGLYGALLLIMLINLASYLYFFKALKQVFSNQLYPFIVLAFLMAFWPYQSWSLYLYTECIFYSATVALFSHLILFKKLHVKFVVATLLLLCLVIISRPLGILFVLPTLLFFFFKLSRRQKVFFYVGSALALVLLNYVVQIVFTTTSDWSMAKALTEDAIICDMPEKPPSVDLQLSNDTNQLYQLFYYVVHNFSHFCSIAFTRLKFFFTMVRDYYSPFHNLYLLVSLLLVYGSILWNIKAILRGLSASLKWFIFSSIFLFALAVALQCDDYHNRFFLTLMPFWVTMALLGWEYSVRRYFSKKKDRGGQP